MELFDLEEGLKAVASGGCVLNCQELTGLQAGLALLKKQEKHDRIFFWGKIFGLKADYYVAYGLRDAEYEFPAKAFYQAGEDFDFKALPRLSEDVAMRVLELALQGPLSGVPTQPVQPVVEGEEDVPPDDEEGAQDGEKVEDKPPPLTEIERLSQVVQEIDFDTAVVPKGAHSLSEAHVVVPQAHFKGLGLTEATSLAKYVHFRPPTSVAARRALARTDAQFYADFLDPLEGDLPKGCWAIRQDASASLVTLRSLSWPGYMAYHLPTTSKYGGVYFGHAQSSRDLPFLL